MAPLRFAANLAWLFQEQATLPQRMEAASQAGFRAAELCFPYSSGAQELREAADRAGLELVLLNTPPGNEAKGDMGLGAVPGCQLEFREGLALAVKYAKILKCPRKPGGSGAFSKTAVPKLILLTAPSRCCRAAILAGSSSWPSQDGGTQESWEDFSEDSHGAPVSLLIHIMAGRIPLGAERDAVAALMEATFIENLRYAADILAQENLIGLLEPINNRITDPRYFLTTPQQAAAILKKVGSPSLKLQLDIFHCQIMDGNLTQNINTYFPIIGHIQIAQVPARHEPDSPGELDYPYLFQLLETMGYSGYVGCEYAPKGDTLEGLGWLHSYWKSHNVLHSGS